MKKIFYIWLVFICCAQMALPLSAQRKNEIPEDEKARELISLGKRYLQTRNYLDAALTFQLAAQRPFNRATTLAIYYTGLAYYYQQEPEKAVESFEDLIRRYPHSRYSEDARYHNILIQLESERTVDRERGLDQAFRIVMNTRNAKLRRDLEESIHYFLYDVYDRAFLELYVLFVDDRFKGVLEEAILDKLDQQAEAELIVQRLEKWESQNGQLTKYMKALKEKYESEHVAGLNQLRVAVMLSFNLSHLDTVSKVPQKSQRALQLYNGIMASLDSLKEDFGKQVILKVFDTEGEESKVAELLDSLKYFHPTVIIGEIKTTLAQQIGEWAEKNHIVQFVPRNSLDTLIAGKEQVFLAHPSLRMHGRVLAQYMANHQKKKFLIINNQTFYSKEYAKGFKEALDTLTGITVEEKLIASPYEMEYKDNPLGSYIRGIKNAGYDAIYLPITDYVQANYFLSMMEYHSVKIQVLGSPDWKAFDKIDGQLKTKLNLTYSDFFYPYNDSTAYEGLRNQSLKENFKYPSDYFIQGYDMMNYLLEASLSISPGKPLAEVLHGMKPYHGIHIDFDFREGQSNSGLSILKYNDGIIEKLNGAKEEQVTVPEGN